MSRLGGLAPVDVRAHHAAHGVDDARERVPGVRAAARRARVAEGAVRADAAVGVEEELRLLVAVGHLGPLVPAGRAEQPARREPAEADLHRQRPLVEVHPSRVLAERHAQHEHRAAHALERRQPRAALQHAEPLAARLAPGGHPLLAAHLAAPEVVEA